VSVLAHCAVDRWGVGHSLGLLLMYAVFLKFGREALTSEGAMAIVAESAVGAFMIGLGLTVSSFGLRVLVHALLVRCLLASLLASWFLLLARFLVFLTNRQQSPDRVACWFA
jgi:hypothetical protein